MLGDWRWPVAAAATDRPRPTRCAHFSGRFAVSDEGKAPAGAPTSRSLPNPNRLIQTVPLLDDPILYLSRANIARKNDCHRLLRAVTAEGAWIEWILFMLGAVRESAASTTRKIGSIQSCQDDITDRARATTLDGRDARFLEVLFGQPYCRIATIVERCEVSRQTASSWLHALVRAGLLTELRMGREVLFVNHEFLDVLTRTE